MMQDQETVANDQTIVEDGALAATIGSQIKERRRTMGLSLRDLGTLTGLSASSLSQIERGVVSLTLNSLTAIARALDLPLFDFFVGNYSDSLVLREGQHLRLKLPGSTVDYELISRRGSTAIAVMRARLQAGHAVYDEPQSHPQEECLFVVRGQIEVYLGGEIITLYAHDAINFDAGTPHRFSNSGDTEAEYILCISPVVF